MTKSIQNSIPIAVSLDPILASENVRQRATQNKRRLLLISSIAVFIAVFISFVAKALVFLINLITNISFHGLFSISSASPVNNTLGAWVIVIPVAGGIIVGLMALYGSKAIRGHGIPEAMEQILTNQSKIKPAIIYLKPLSSAVSIGMGGPFGAEGPIIATGGALGSAIGQLLKISHHERKILLAAGATAGMSAIFGSPIAAIFLAIELLLFEFSPRSIIPVSLACITGAAGHHLLFGSEPVFAMKHIIAMPSNTAIAAYSFLGILIGLSAVFITKFVYFVEDSFEKLPVHWMWWPAMGGLAVGIIGYWDPRTLGVGYNNITDILNGNILLQSVLLLCVLKFLSWSIALGSGTSGGTLAPLLIVGGATGTLIGSAFQYVFPSAGVSLSLSALVGMSAMFAGASRAFLTSIIFALETTGQSNALLPLLATCGASYITSFLLMENTIMTEKISRRGVKTPVSYEPDILDKIRIEDVMQKEVMVLSEHNTLKEVLSWLDPKRSPGNDHFIISSASGEYKGIVNSADLYLHKDQQEALIGDIMTPGFNTISVTNSLRNAVETMATENIDVLTVLSKENDNVIGILSYKDILPCYKLSIEEHHKKHPDISLKRRSLKVLIHSKRIINSFKP